MDFKKLVKPYENLLITTLSHFVSIPSVYDKDTVSSEVPYGEYVNKALYEFNKLGEMYGFNVEFNKRYVELSIGNEGPLIEVFGHLDVVPVNKNLKKDPFTLIEENGILYGRGVADDKGPLLAAFFALKALKDNDLISGARIKIFAGGDEERGSSCLTYYVNEMKKEIPAYGFTPDSGFPVIYGEKGAAFIVVKKKIHLKNIKEIKGGTAPNIVIQECKFIVDNIDDVKDKLKEKNNINNDEINFIGLSAHGSQPQNGRNAFLIGLKDLSLINNDVEASNFVDLFLEYSGKKLNAFYTSEHLKDTVFNIGCVSYQNDELTLSINFRFPENVKPEVITQNVLKTIDATLVSESSSPALLFDLKSPLITSLLDAYKEETNDLTPPVISAGGTYAKEVGNTVAFGAEYNGKNYKMHEDDEYMPKDDLFLTMSIYAHALYNLINLKK